MLEIAAESPASGARFVGKNWGKHDTPPKNQNPDFQWLDFTRATIFYKPDFALKMSKNWKNGKAENLLKPLLKPDFAKSLLC